MPLMGNMKNIIIIHKKIKRIPIPSIIEDKYIKILANRIPTKIKKIKKIKGVRRPPK